MEMVLPRNYVEIEQEEMMYLEGGEFVSKTDAANAIAFTMMSPSSFLLAASSVVMVKKAVSFIYKKFGGVWGWVAGALFSWATAQVIALGTGLARGAMNQGVTLSWNWNIFNDPIGVNASVHYKHSIS